MRALRKRQQWSVDFVSRHSWSFVVHGSQVTNTPSVSHHVADEVQALPLIRTDNGWPRHALERHPLPQSMPDAQPRFTVHTSRPLSSTPSPFLRD